MFLSLEQEPHPIKLVANSTSTEVSHSDLYVITQNQRKLYDLILSLIVSYQPVTKENNNV